MKKCRYFFLLAVLCVVTLVLLSGCKKPNEEPPAAIPTITLAADGASSYVIVRADDASASVVAAASELWSNFKDKTGVKIDLCDEYRYTEKGKPVAIVVGTTTDETSLRLKSGMRLADFTVHVEGSHLYLVGGSDEATVNAVNWFIENYLKEPVQSLTVEGNLDMRYTHEYPFSTLTVAGNDLSSYRIVYDADLYYSGDCAKKVQSLIADVYGFRLETVPDTEAASANEILIGDTNREESGAVISQFALPNRYWSVSVSGAKLVLANQGVRSGDAAISALEKMLGKVGEKTFDLSTSTLNLSGDVLSTDKKGIPRADGTDIRVMQSNVEGTLGNKPNGYTNQQRAELLADTYLVYFPDVITFNELYITTDRELVKYLVPLLEPYYAFAEPEWLGLYSNSEETSYGQPIAYRKDAGLTVLDAGFNYLSDLINYHGASWAVFEATNGNRFLVLAAHLSKNEDSNGKTITTWVENVMEIANLARLRYGNLPMVFGGDWYFSQSQSYYGAAYDYMIAQGLVDASETALKKHSPTIGTYHPIGEGKQDGVKQDLFFITPEWFQALSHKVIVDFYTVNASDHYPVITDIQFTKSATENDIPNDFDGKLDIEEEGTVGSGSWGDGEKLTVDGVYALADYSNLIKVYGRSFASNDGIACDFSGAGIEFNARISGDVVLKIYSSGTTYYTLYVNGVRQEQRLKFNTGTAEYTILKDLAEGEYNIKLLKQTQIEFTVSALMSLKFNGTFAEKPSDKDVLIEFIGDSITCGFGTVGYPTDGVENYRGADHMDATKAYSYLTAEQLGADHSLISMSGWSLLPGENGGSCVPNVYSQTCYKRSNELYTPTRSADIVVIHLGTNDIYYRDNYASDFVSAAKLFIEEIRRINPNAKIVWAYGSMMSGTNLNDFEAKVNTIINDCGGADAGFYRVKLPTDYNGAHKHPTEATHVESARILAQFITENVLN